MFGLFLSGIADGRLLMIASRLKKTPFRKIRKDVCNVVPLFFKALRGGCFFKTPLQCFLITPLTAESRRLLTPLDSETHFALLR